MLKFLVGKHLRLVNILTLTKVMVIDRSVSKLHFLYDLFKLYPIDMVVWNRNILKVKYFNYDYRYLVLTITLLEPKLICLCHQYRVRPACISM